MHPKSLANLHAEAEHAVGLQPTLPDYLPLSQILVRATPGAREAIKDIVLERVQVIAAHADLARRKRNASHALIVADDVRNAQRVLDGRLPPPGYDFSPDTRAPNRLAELYTEGPQMPGHPHALGLDGGGA